MTGAFWFRASVSPFRFLRRAVIVLPVKVDELPYVALLLTRRGGRDRVTTVETFAVSVYSDVRLPVIVGAHLPRRAGGGEGGMFCAHGDTVLLRHEEPADAAVGIRWRGRQRER